MFWFVGAARNYHKFCIYDEIVKVFFIPSCLTNFLYTQGNNALFEVFFPSSKQLHNMRKSLFPFVLSESLPSVCLCGVLDVYSGLHGVHCVRDSLSHRRRNSAVQSGSCSNCSRSLSPPNRHFLCFSSALPLVVGDPFLSRVLRTLNYIRIPIYLSVYSVCSTHVCSPTQILHVCKLFRALYTRLSSFMKG